MPHSRGVTPQFLLPVHPHRLRAQRTSARSFRRSTPGSAAPDRREPTGEQVFRPQPDDRVRTLLQVPRPRVDIENRGMHLLVGLPLAVVQQHRRVRGFEGKVPEPVRERPRGGLGPPKSRRNTDARCAGPLRSGALEPGVSVRLRLAQNRPGDDQPQISRVVPHNLYIGVSPRNTRPISPAVTVSESARQHSACVERRVSSDNFPFPMQQALRPGTLVRPA
jgi:hypothetical protein